MDERTTTPVSEAVGSATMSLVDVVLSRIDHSGWETAPQRAAAKLKDLVDDLNACATALEQSGDEAPEATRRRITRVIADRVVARQLREATGIIERSTRSPSKFKLVEVAEACPKCGGATSLRRGRFGAFLGCVRYPECDGKLRASLGVRCPEPNCEGQLIEKSKDDRVEGVQSFVGCSGYRSKGQGCQFVIWSAPERIPCHRCSLPFVVNSYGVRSCIDSDCVSEKDVAELQEGDRVERLAIYALRLCGPMIDGAGTLVNVAGVMCGMANATPESAFRVFERALERGRGWYARTRKS